MNRQHRDVALTGFCRRVVHVEMNSNSSVLAVFSADVTSHGVSTRAMEVSIDMAGVYVTFSAADETIDAPLNGTKRSPFLRQRELPN